MSDVRFHDELRRASRPVQEAAGRSPSDVASSTKEDTPGHKSVHLLFVEDDDDYRETVSAGLVELGFSVQGFSGGLPLLDSLSQCVDADAIVLDWGMPDIMGIDLLRKLRRQVITLPVIFLTGRSSPENEALAFDRGAHDFVAKARGVSILAVRIRSILNLAKPGIDGGSSATLQSGHLMLKCGVSRAYWRGIDLQLTSMEFRIVHMLASNVGNYVTYRAIYDSMHYSGFVAGSGIDGYRTNVRSSIKRIRNNFRLVDPGFEGIYNFPAHGYCWRQ